MPPTVDHLLLAERCDPRDRGRFVADAVQASSSDDPAIRAAAAQAVGWTGGPGEALPVLERLSVDPTVMVRTATAAALARCPWRGRGDILETLLCDMDPQVVSIAAQGLSYLGDLRAVPTLLTLLQTRDRRLNAAEGLLRLAAPDLDAWAHATFPRWWGASRFERAIAALHLVRRFGDARASAYLQDRFGRRRAPERPLIVVWWASHDAQVGRPHIEALADDSTDYLRESAWVALAKLDHPGAWTRLQLGIGTAADTDPSLAAELLGALSEVDAARADLIAVHHCGRPDALGDEARAVRLQAALRALAPAEVWEPCV